MADYIVDSKDLSTAISKCLGVIALGEKAESNSVTLVFHKKGQLTVEAINSMAAYASDIVVEATKGVDFRAHVLPELLLSYAKNHKSLTLTPTKSSLKVTAKAFKADIFYVGQNEEVSLDKPKSAQNLKAVATMATRALSLVSGIRNRTDAQDLGIMLKWEDKTLECTVGDTHHAIVVDAEISESESGSVVMALPSLQKIMLIGQNFSNENNQFIAWNETEYLSILSQSESVFVADSAREVVRDSKATTKFMMETDKFTAMVETLTDAVDESTVLSLSFKQGVLSGSVKTGAGSASAKTKLSDLKGKSGTVNVTVHHLKDCMSTLKSKTFEVLVYPNMLALRTKDKHIVCTALMAVTGD